MFPTPTRTPEPTSRSSSAGRPTSRSFSFCRDALTTNARARPLRLVMQATLGLAVHDACFRWRCSGVTYHGNSRSAHIVKRARHRRARQLTI